MRWIGRSRPLRPPRTSRDLYPVGGYDHPMIRWVRRLWSVEMFHTDGVSVTAAPIPRWQVGTYLRNGWTLVPPPYDQVIMP
jgi:hypothetical protein